MLGCWDAGESRYMDIQRYKKAAAGRVAAITNLQSIAHGAQ